MKLTKNEERQLAEIESWENRFFQEELSDIERIYSKWVNNSFRRLGEKRQEKLLSIIDHFLFYLQTSMQHSNYYDEASKRLLLQAQVFNSEIQTIRDFKKLSIEQLKFIASQQMAKQRLVSFAQGGASGMGGFFLLGVDLPAMLMINLRTIQLLAQSYGYDINRPFETFIALRLFHTATLPKKMQKRAWNNLWEELENYEYEGLFYRGDEQIVDAGWLQQPLKQIVKMIAISLLRKKVIQGVPLLGMAVGATINYQFTKQVTDVAHAFYQKRHLYEKLS